MNEHAGGRDVLWSGTFPGVQLQDRLQAAAANGFHGLSVSLTDLESLRAAGDDPVELRREARDKGVERLVIESVTSWYRHESPPAWFTAARFTVDDFLRAAELIGVTDVHVVAAMRTLDPPEAFVERFAALCDRFEGGGLVAHLEFAPVTPIPSLADAWDIVRNAGRPNGGLVFDTWHFFRGDPDFDLLASIPGDRILSVQVSDGASELRETLLKDTMRHRLLPGQGVFDLVGVARTLRKNGGLHLVGPEVLSVEFEGVSPVEVARRAGAALDAVFGAASVEA